MTYLMIMSPYLENIISATTVTLKKLLRMIMINELQKLQPFCCYLWEICLTVKNVSKDRRRKLTWPNFLDLHGRVWAWRIDEKRVIYLRFELMKISSIIKKRYHDFVLLLLFTIYILTLVANNHGVVHV